MKEASLNKLGTGVKKTNIDFGKSTWNMEYVYFDSMLEIIFFYHHNKPLNSEGSVS